ncbi:oligosaccharide flippase family protein [Chloroflexota bacterium]
MFIMRLLSFAKETLVDAARMLTSKEGLKSLYGVSLYRNAIYLIMTNLAGPLIGFAFWIVAARFYTAEDVGLVAALIAILGLLTLLSTLGLDFGLIRFLPHSGQSANRIINSSLTISGLASIVFCGIFLAGINIWSPALLILVQEPIYLAAFIAFTVITTLLTIVGSTFIAKRRSSFVMAYSLISGLLKLPLPILLAAFFHSFGLFASWGLSTALALVISILFFLPRAQPDYHFSIALTKSAINEMVRFSFINYIAHLCWSLPGSVLPIMVLNMLGAETNAHFYIAWSIGALLTSFPFAISTSLFSEGSYDGQSLSTYVWRSVKLTFLILIPIVVIIVIMADKLLLLFGNAYSEGGTTLLYILALSSFPTAINYIYLTTKRVEKKLAVIIGLSSFIAITTLALSYLLLPQMGVNGAGIAWLVTQGIAALMIAASLLRRRRVI